MTKILAFAGEKQSGKTTACKFIAGLLLQKAGVIKRYSINDDGDLIVNCVRRKEDGSLYEDDGILDLERKDEEFFEYASRNIWPIVKLYSFAELLKETCINLFGLDRDCIYGSNEQKNKETKIRWSTIKKFMKESYYDKTGFMTHREFMEFFGTDICRAIIPTCHATSCINLILKEAPDYALITDCRFEDEVNLVKQNNGTVIRLTKTLGDNSTAKSEKINLLPDRKFDANINNNEMTIHEKNDAIFGVLQSLEWFTS